MTRDVRRKCPAREELPKAIAHVIKKKKKALHSRANLGILIIKQYDLQKARKANAHQTYKSNV